MSPRAGKPSAGSSSVAPAGATLVVPVVFLIFASLCLPGPALSQEADSTRAIPADKAPVAADSAAALPDSAGVAYSDSSRITMDDSMRFYDSRQGVGLSPFSGKSVKREREDMLALSTTTSGEAFAFEPGIDLIEYGSAGLPQALRMRTSWPRDAVYLMDGIPVSDSRLETFDLNWLPLAGIAGAEVTMNGQSGLHGSGATGGVMNLQSMSAMPQVPTSEVVAWWGSFGSRAIHFRFNRRITSRFGILLCFENLHSGGWIESSEADRNKFFGKLSGFLGQGMTYDVVGYRYDGSVELPDSCPELAGTNSASRDDKRDYLRVSVAGGTNISVRLDYCHLGTERDWVSGGASGWSKGRLDAFSASTSWATVDSLTTTVGGGLKRCEVEDEYDKETASDVYAYAAVRKRLERWRFRGSLRGEIGDPSGTEFGGDLGASYKAMPWCVLFGRIDRSYAFPGLQDRLRAHEFGPRGGEAEHWNSLELGTHLGPEPVKLSAALFWRQVDNSALLSTNEECEMVPVGDKELSCLGAEALLSFTHPAWLKGSIGYSVERVRDGNGDKLSYDPSGTFTWDLRTHRKFSGHVSAGLTFAGHWTSPLYMGNQTVPCSGDECLEDAELDGYVSGLLYGYIDVDSGRVYVRVRNLFNQAITRVWGLPELPSRSYEFGVNLELFD